MTLEEVIELCENGDPEACAFMGKEYYFGWRIDQDIDKAFRYLSVAAESGDSTSQFLLAFLYGSSRGTEKDNEKALELFLKAAEQGVPEAMYNAGCILLGKPGDEDRALGKKWLVRSANAGYDPAYSKLSELEE